MKKSVHIIEASATGTLSMATLIANAQASAGHRVTVIYSKRPETPANIADHFDSKIKTINIQMNNTLSKARCIPKIHQTLKESNPDNIFLHSSFAGFLGRISCIGLPIKPQILYIPHCISFMRQDISTIKRFVFIFFEWVAAIKKSDYVACSKSEQKAIQAAIPFRKCHLVENALNLSSIPPLSDKDLSARKKTVITVGQIRPQKGPATFAEITRSAKAADPSIEFVWVGDGDPEARRELEDAGVRVLGWVPKSQVWEHLGNARLYLSTARWEGMPVSVIEASFAGLPVVASSCAGNVDVVEHDKTGWLFNTPGEATGHVLSSLENPELSQSVAKTAFDIAKQRFSVERYFREMEALTKS